MQIRVLHIVGQLGFGGVELQLRELSRRTDPARFKIGICYFGMQGEARPEEFVVPGVDLLFIDKRNMPMWRFFGQLRRVIREFRPDVIVTWQMSPNWWGRLAAATCGYGRIIAMDRTWNLNFTMRWQILEKVACRRTWHVANSGAVARRISDGLGIPIEKVRVIHNAVEVPDRDRAADRADVRRELGLAPDQPIVLTVGRLTKAKNYPMFFRTARRVLAERGDVAFMSAGAGPLEAEMVRLHGEMALGQGVRMLGLRRDVPRLLAAADVFCLCSLWEGFPNVLAEAMAGGLAVVTTRFPGCDDVIEEGRTAVAVPLDDDAAMAEAVLALLVDPARRSALGAAARESVADRLSWDRLVADMGRLYEDFLAGDPARHDTAGQSPGGTAGQTRSGK